MDAIHTKNNTRVRRLEQKANSPKLTTKKKNAIDKVVKIYRDMGATPEEVRYMQKKEREIGGWQTPNKGRKLPDYLSEPEIGAILNKSIHADSTTRLLVSVAIFTGLRIAELRNLKIEDIDYDQYQIKVVQGKGSKDRFVPAKNNLLIQIKDYVGDRKSGFLFVKSNHTPFSVRGLQKKIEKIFIVCRFVKKLSAHSLRHTYASLLRRNGMQLQDIQILLGHSTIKTTEIYAHIEIAPIKEQFFQLIGFN
jgi:integrase/recombinase XerD